MSVYYQNALASFIATKLNDNPYDIAFNVNLYNNIDNDEFSETNKIINTYKTRTTRYVPTMITGINGEYIPIPNLNGTTNSVEIVFDLAVDDMTGIDEDGFLPANYNNTLLAIDNFKKTILANYFPLGTVNIMMGGEDSTIVSVGTTSFTPKFIYLKFKPKNNDTEELLRGVDNSSTVLTKTPTHIEFDVDGTNIISVPYTVNVETEITINQTVSSIWTISNGTDTDTYTVVTSNDYQNFNIGYNTGFEGTIQRLVIDENYFEEVSETEIHTIDLKDFTDKDLITNSGQLTGTTITVNNSILYGDDGNAVFQVYPLAVIGNYDAQNGINYRSFSLQLEAMVGDDFLFGNNFEYYIDSLQVYPVDRNHTYGAEIEGRQGMNENFTSFVATESGLDFTQTFFYQPVKHLTSLLKKITTNELEQNKTYTLKVQYPFWNTYYSVLVSGGGLNTDLNSITTFTLQFKQADKIVSEVTIDYIDANATASAIIEYELAINQDVELPISNAIANAIIDFTIILNKEIELLAPATANVSIGYSTSGNREIGLLAGATANVVVDYSIIGDQQVEITASATSDVTVVTEIILNQDIELIATAMVNAVVTYNQLKNTAKPSIIWLSTVDYKGTDWDITFRITNDDLQTADLYADTGISTPTTLLGSTLSVYTRDVTYRIAQVFGSELTCTTQAKITGNYDSLLENVTSPSQ